MKPLVHDTTIEYWASKVEEFLVPSRHHEGYATTNMKLYWRRVMSTFVDYVSSRKVKEVMISPPSTEFFPIVGLFQIRKQLWCGLLDRIWDLLSGGLTLMVGSFMGAMFP